MIMKASAKRRGFLHNSLQLSLFKESIEEGHHDIFLVLRYDQKNQ